MKDEWQTPKELFNKLNDEFNFDVDVACNDKNCLCDCGLTDSLNVLDWAMLPDYPNMIFWMNPPYSKPNLLLFSKKAYEESQKGCIVVGLLPLDCSTKWFKEYVMKSDEIRYLGKRVRFIDPNTGKPKGSPAFASVIVVWKKTDKTVPTVSMYEW